MKILKFGLKYWKKNLILAIIIQLVSYIAIVADLLLPLISELFIDYIITDSHGSTKGVFAFLLNGKYGQPRTFELFYHIALVFGMLLATRLLLIYIKNTSLQRLGLRMETDLRIDTFHKLMELDSATISEYNTGELLTTINSDTIMFKEMFSRMIPNILDSIFVLITCVYLLTTINSWLLLIPLLLTPFLIIALKRFMRIARKNYGIIRGANSEMSRTVQENIEAVRIVRSFTNEELEKRKFDISNDKLRESYISQIKLSSKFEVIFSSIKQIAYIGSLAVSTILVLRGKLLVGFFVASSSYVLKIMDHITQINQTLFHVQQQLVSGKMIMEFMSASSKVAEENNAKKIHDMPAIQVQNASLTMDGKQVLKNINLDIPYGKKVGIVGGTGSGKSVLLKTLSRIYDLTEGSIKINGKDIREYTLESLNNCFSYVFQEVFLFSNTIDSNIAYAIPDIEKEQVEQAAKHAQAHKFITKLPQGYETIVGEKGIGISGGQKQRVSIARALLKNAPVLVLDDSTSALDVNTEKRLLEDIKKYYPDKTILLSAHRLSSVVDCDEIIYMQDGEIVERGSFDELMKLGGHFASVYQVQQVESKSRIDYTQLVGEE